MRNDRFNVLLQSDCGQPIRYLNPGQAAALLAQGTARVVSWAGEKLRRAKVIALAPPPPRPSDSDTSPAAITLADMLANVGIPRRNLDYISRGRIEAAQQKIAAWQPRQ